MRYVWLHRASPCKRRNVVPLLQLNWAYSVMPFSTFTHPAGTGRFPSKLLVRWRRTGVRLADDLNAQNGWQTSLTCLDCVDVNLAQTQKRRDTQQELLHDGRWTYTEKQLWVYRITLQEIDRRRRYLIRPPPKKQSVLPGNKCGISYASDIVQCRGLCLRLVRWFSVPGLFFLVEQSIPLT